MKMNSLIGLSKNNQQQNNTYISSLGERRDRKLNDTNFVTTASKFIPN